jgi:hypothetical protein
VSTEIVKSEIKRFLASSDAEVLCIKGKWGVGKTFAWMQYLGEAESSKKLGLDRYAYVSLFGLNDLESLRYAIFESTVATGQFLSSPDISSLRAMLERAGNFGRKARPLFAPLFNAMGISDAGEALSRAAFLSVRKQVVCLDDLERSGSSLDIRDVLGLASMLKEQRHCKVILLLNDEQLKDEDKTELQRQLEKVVDVSLVFEPSPEDAVSIAFSKETPVNQRLKPKVVNLGITNIRVIKKIERMADRMAQLLSTFRDEVTDQGIHATVLGGWSVLQPDIAPPIEFLKRHNSLLSAMRAKKDDEPEDERQWEEVIERYGWSHCDELDLAIFEGVAAGYFNEAKILEAAKKVQADFENSKENSSFSKAWRIYHDSFTVDDEYVLDNLYNGAKESIHTISPANLSGTVTLMREFGRDIQADELVNLYLSQPLLNGNQLEVDMQMWGAEPIDPTLSAGFEKLKADFVDTRDPREVLVAMVTNRGWNEDDIVLLGKQSAEDFEKIFESIEGPILSAVVKFALSLGGHEGPNHKLVGTAVTKALQSIATKSPLRKRRIASYGVAVN